MLLGINKDISNNDYHSDNEFVSSSVLKTILTDKEKFIRKYVNKELDKNSNQSALDFGTAAHLMLLEPHLFYSDVVEFKGLRKAGSAWDQFKSENQNKLIMSSSELLKLDTLKHSFLNHPHGPQMLEGCEFEHTMCESIDGIKVKSRADAISMDKGYIADVKTTGMMADTDSFKTTINSLSYDLSAALYCNIAKMIHNKPFDFYYIVLCKNDLTCHIYKTSKATMEIGQEKLNQSLELYKHFLLTGEVKEIILNSDNNNEIQEV